MRIKGGCESTERRQRPCSTLSVAHKMKCGVTFVQQFLNCSITGLKWVNESWCGRQSDGEEQTMFILGH